MSRARLVADLLTTPPSAYTTDSELAGELENYLTESSASTIYQGSPNRNLIINGAMQVAQRGTSTASITAAGYFTADRWVFNLGSMGTWTNSVETDAPTGSGFAKSFKVLCTTADAAPAASDILLIQQRLEGQNLQSIKKGTANAEQLTLSFWVKSNVTGTYIFELADNDNTRNVSAAYTVNASGIWEKKIIVLPADATGAFDNDNDLSLVLNFWLGAGTDRTSGTLQTTWASVVNANRVVGQTNLAAATNNYWQITGVQLEVGAIATPFEFKPIEQELAECQRYYWRSETTSGYAPIGQGWAQGTTSATFHIYHPVAMRANASLVEYSTLSIGDNISINSTFTTLTLSNSGILMSHISVSGSSGLTQYRPYYLRTNNNSAGYLGLSAEL